MAVGAATEEDKWNYPTTGRALVLAGWQPEMVTCF